MRFDPYKTLLQSIAPMCAEAAAVSGGLNAEAAFRAQIMFLNYIFLKPLPHAPMSIEQLSSLCSNENKNSWFVFVKHMESTEVEFFRQRDSGKRLELLQELNDLVGFILPHVDIIHSEAEQTTDWNAFNIKISQIWDRSDMVDLCISLKKYFGDEMDAYPNIVRCVEHAGRRGRNIDYIPSQIEQLYVISKAEIDRKSFFSMLYDNDAVDRISIMKNFIQREKISLEEALLICNEVINDKDPSKFIRWFQNAMFLIDLYLTYDVPAAEIMERINVQLQEYHMFGTDQQLKKAFNKRNHALSCIRDGQLDSLNLKAIMSGGSFIVKDSFSIFAAFSQYHHLEIDPNYFFTDESHRIFIPSLGLFIKVLENQHPSFPHLFADLMKKFQRVSDLPMIDDAQKRSIDTFFPVYYEKILLLTDIMGKAAFKWLSDQMAQTVLPLERLLFNLPNKLPDELLALLRNYFERNQDSIMRSGLQSWQNIISGLAAYHSIISNIPEKQIDFAVMQTLFKQPIIEFVSHDINKNLVQLIISTMHLSPEMSDSVDIDRVLSCVPPNQFSLLINEKLKMAASANPFAGILDGLISRFLLGQSIDHFLHDPSSSIGRHNANIQRRLQSAGIDPNVALRFTGNKEFSIRSEKAEQSDRLAAHTQTLLGFLDRVRGIVARLPMNEITNKKIKDQLTAIQTNYDAIKNPRTPESHKWNHYTKINKNVSALLQQQFFQQDGLSEFREFAVHFQNQYALTLEEKNKPSMIIASPKKSEDFVVEQWDKTRIETLFLGNEVECCLAAGSTQFPAILQRIMDDAMLFHVVTEKNTGAPIALSWLYLAEDETGKIYIIANFLEIKAKYGADEPSRKIIIDELLRFTGEQYCVANPGISGFLINELDYGWNCRKLREPIETIPLVDKVGGALLPNTAVNAEEIVSEDAVQSNQSKTSQVYYLTSLARPQMHFHVYPTYAPVNTETVAAAAGKTVSPVQTVGMFSNSASRQSQQPTATTAGDPSTPTVQDSEDKKPSA